MSTNEHADRALAVALGTGASYARAAEIAGVSRATVARRMSEESFRALVEDLRADQVGRIEGRLGDLSGNALGALEELLADSDAPAQRLGATRVVLEGVLKYREAGAVEARIAALEERLSDHAELNGARGR